VTYQIKLSRTAIRALANDLPMAVVDAVLELMRGDLAEEPKRVGKPLGGSLVGQWSARRGVYRILYKIDEDAEQIMVLDIGHRADVYRRS
jgi:mRNA interferase RelE/StbE